MRTSGTGAAAYQPRKAPCPPRSRRLAHETGQTLAIFALMLPALIGLSGLGVDSSNVYLHYRNAQTAADLGALAGARLLPNSPTSTDYINAENRAVSVATSNGYSSGVTANAPYVDDGGQTHTNQMEVVITSTVQTYFLPLLGVSTMDVNVRAVAGSDWTASGGTFPAVFAGCTNISECPYWDPQKAIDWSGSDGEILGGMHSNCGISVGGQMDEVQGSTTYNGTCTFNDGGNTFTPSAGQGPHQDFPVDYTASTFTCDVTVDGKLELKNYYDPPTSKTIEPGVYCARGNDAEIVLDESNVTGNVTLVVDRFSGGPENCSASIPVGKKVAISGQFFDLTAYHSTKVLIYTNVREPPAVEISGSDGNWNGLIVARCGHVVISGQSTSTNGGGSILANTVQLAGSNINIDSNGLSTLGPATLDHLRLYE